MSFVFAQPPVLAAASTDLAGIGSAIGEASAAAAGPTIGIATAAADEVSAAVANLFGVFGEEFQAVNAQLATAYGEFVQKLTATAQYYVNAEAINSANLVQSATSGLTRTPAPSLPAAFLQNTAIIMGGTGTPIPGAAYVDAVNTLFVQRINPGALTSPLFTPEQLYPITGVRSLPLDTSVAQGLQILDTTVRAQLAAGNQVTVFGYSQSAIISSLLMEHYISLGPLGPDPSALNFIFIGNEMNPNGGFLARIPGLNIATLGLPFYGSAPDGPYQTTTYTLEYDGFADFPRYPLNFISDLNAVFGIINVHTTYASLTPEQINSAILLDTEGPTINKYYIIPTEHLPLLAPVRAIPVIGEPIAALVEPNLRVIVNLGYGDPNFGYSTSPANVPTPFGLFPDVSPDVVTNAFVAGTQKGLNDFAAAVPVALTSTPEIAPPVVPRFTLVPPTPVVATPVSIANTVASVVSTGYSVLLPTADLGLAFATTLPAYNANLFLSQLLQGNLRAAIELPLAATVGLGAVGAMIELIAIVEAAASISQSLQGIGI